MLRLTLAALAVVAVALANEESTRPAKGAWLLASKAPQSQYAVENMDYAIEYGLYNVGDKAATKITLDDRHSYPTQYFQIVSGAAQITVPRINAGETFTHVIIVRPQVSGVYNFTPAQVTYIADEDKDMRAGLTTAPGESYVYKQADYDRRFGSKFPHFAVFFALMAPLSLFALNKFVSSKRHFEALEADGKKYKNN